MLASTAQQELFTQESQPCSNCSNSKHTPHTYLVHMLASAITLNGTQAAALLVQVLSKAGQLPTGLKGAWVLVAGPVMSAGLLVVDAFK